MKARNLATIAVVATGAVALSAPAAFAEAPDVSGLDRGVKKVDALGKAAKKQARAARESKFQKRTGEDIKRLGENVRDLRRGQEETNATIANIVSGLTPVLSLLATAAQSYANFEYGVAQMTVNGQPYPPGFLTTSRIEPTAQQASVTKQFACDTFSATTVCTTGAKIGFKVVVRSLDPGANNDKTTAACSMSASQDAGPGAANAQRWGITIPKASTSINDSVNFYSVPRVFLPPKSKDEQAPSLFTMAPSEFAVATTFLGPDGRSLGTGDSLGGGVNAGNFPLTAASAGGGMVTATLSCLGVPKT